MARKGKNLLVGQGENIRLEDYAGADGHVSTFGVADDYNEYFSAPADAVKEIFTAMWKTCPTILNKGEPNEIRLPIVSFAMATKAAVAALVLIRDMNAQQSLESSGLSSQTVEEDTDYYSKRLIRLIEEAWATNDALEDI